MTKTERLAVAKVFRAAKLKLWNGVGKEDSVKERYICHAIDAVKASQNFKDLAGKVVLDRLWPSFFLQHWMLNNHPHLDTSIKVMMQRTRHAWLDSMIEEFEA